ncbi:retrovirus-related pol polyprotein from transposon TNT 1-94 [Tanacetum coccineum]
MPLSDKTILDSLCFVHELKREMNDDLEYVNSLEKELDELESEKTDFSNIYDLLLEEYVSKDVTCSYLHSLSDLNAYAELMHSRFEMSLMGEMKFFLGLQIHQSPNGIFINQAKYALEILKKHNMDNYKSDYRSKIGPLMYLTSSRPDLVQAVCYCARYQARPTWDSGIQRILALN